MLAFIRTLCIALITIFIMTSVSFAQTSGPEGELNINDIAGNWRIEVIDRPDDDFKGTAMIPRGIGKTIMAETITEDKCCDGKNHARVLQNSRITITNGKIEVTSKIVKYLLREEELKMTYSPDDFSLTQLDKNTLIGTANGYTRVRWVRDEFEVS